MKRKKPVRLLPGRSRVKNIIYLKGGSKTLIEFPPDIERQMRDIAFELGLTEGEVLSMAIQFTHRAMEVRKGGEFIGAITKDQKSFRRLEPKPFSDRFGKI